MTRLTRYRNTRETLYDCMRIMERAMLSSLARRDKEPVYADHLSHLSAQLQLCAAAVLDIHCSRNDDDIDVVLEGGSGNEGGSANEGRQALEIALNMEATVFIAQPTVQRYIKRKWYSSFTLASLNPKPNPTPSQAAPHTGTGSGAKSGTPGGRWNPGHGLVGTVLLLALLLVQLPLLVPVALYPALENRLKYSQYYLLSAPVIKFTFSFLSGECTSALLPLLPPPPPFLPLPLPLCLSASLPLCFSLPRLRTALQSRR